MRRVVCLALAGMVREALAACSCGGGEGGHALALLDLDLPGLDGVELARLLRKRGVGIPLLAITARADAEAERQARAAGMQAFLRKPVTGAMLAQAIAGLPAPEPSGAPAG